MTELIDEVRAALPGVECSVHPAGCSVEFALGGLRYFVQRNGVTVHCWTHVKFADLHGIGPDFDHALKALFREARDLQIGRAHV